VLFFAIPLREELSAMDKKPPAPPEDEPYKPADANPAAARVSVLIKRFLASICDWP
jgi:hypothetical protein